MRTSIITLHLVLNLMLFVYGTNGHNYIGEYPRNLGVTTKGLDKLLVIKVFYK